MTLPADTTPPYVIKRDGSTALFDLGKIRSALERAGKASGEFEAPEAARLAQLALAQSDALRGLDAPNIEQIQDAVEAALFGAGHRQTLRAYTVYRDQHHKLRTDRKALIDVEASMTEYLDKRDWRVNANANQGYSLGGLILNVSGKVIANYWLNHVYPPEVGAAHRNADLHIHDLDMLAGYCAGWSLRMLLTEGLNGVPGKVESAPPKHMSSAVGQIVNFLGTLQNEWAGAQAFSSFDTYMAPYVRNDALTYPQVKQYIQELVYNLNVPSRWGTQTPFTNLTFDWICPEDLREQVPVIGGVEMPFVYGDLQVEMDMINRAYIEVMMQGDAKGRVFTFPIPTYNITEDFDWHSENAELLFEMTARYGLPYFQNFLNSELKPNMIRSMCCRLQLDLRRRRAGPLGAPGRADGTGPGQPGNQAQGDPAPHGQRPVPVHQALPRHPAQPLLDARRERHQRNDPQLQRRRLRHHQRGRPRAGGAPARPRARAHARIPRPDRQHVQPRGDAGRGHHLPLRQGRPEALPDDFASGHGGHAVLHQLVATAGRLHRRPVRGA
jgi:ribonucleoside-triphosphate reductase (formate)